VLRTFVRRLVPKRADAAEVMQEVALVLWRNLASKSVLKWLLEKAHFETVNYPPKTVHLTL
jgi:DNA-directed RNA polymerase specialized sigma24 family protein